MGKLASVLLSVLLFSSLAFAETLYVRPEGGSYGLEDGSSYANAVPGLTNVAWGEGAGNVGPGDTLMVCGTHVDSITTNAGIATQGSITPVSGTSDIARTVIDGACTGNSDPGTIWQPIYYKYAAGGWESPVAWQGAEPTYPNVWRLISKVQHSSRVAWTDISGATGTKLTESVWVDEATSLTIVSAAEDSFTWFYNGAVDKDTIYVNVNSGSDPTDILALGNYGYYWLLDGLEYITFQNLNFRETFRHIGYVADEIDHLTIDSCNFAYAVGTSVGFGPGTDYLIVTNSEFSFATNGGVYGNTSAGTKATNFYIAYNYFHDIIGTSDAHAFGVQGNITDSIIEHNRMSNCGTGPAFHPYPYDDMYGIVIRYNLIEDMVTAGGAVGNGIHMTGTQYNFGREELQIYGNIIDNCVNGIRTHSGKENETFIYGNTIVNCTKGIGTVLGKYRIAFSGASVAFADSEVVTSTSGGSATIQATISSGTTPNISGEIALTSTEIANFLNGDTLSVGGSPRATQVGNVYIVSDHFTAKNNLFYNNTVHISAGQAVANVWTVTSDNNIFYPDETTRLYQLGIAGDHYGNLAEWQGIVRAGSTFDPLSTSVDPLFVGATDFHLQGASPAKAAGLNLGTGFSDFAGVNLPTPYGWPIGAYGYNSFGGGTGSFSGSIQ